jgi:hypothetical protein
MKSASCRHEPDGSVRPIALSRSAASQPCSSHQAQPSSVRGSGVPAASIAAPDHVVMVSCSAALNGTGSQHRVHLAHDAVNGAT